MPLPKIPRLSFFLFAVATLLLSVALAQTRGGTLITNTASVSFTDSDGNDRTTVSNTVEIFVQTVYDFTITPDEGRAPSGGSANNFAGYEELDSNNDLSGLVGDEVTFTYTLTNNTNNAIGVLLEALQATTDDFNLTGVTITVTDANRIPVTPVGGVYTLEQNGVYTTTVTGTIPAGVQGNAVALVDLVATNQGAEGEPNPAVGPNVSYENNNVGRVTVGEVPAIGAAKTATSVNNGNGSYTVT